MSQESAPLTAELVMEVLSAQSFPNGVPPALRTVRLQPVQETNGSFKVQVGNSNPVARAWFAQLLPNFVPAPAAEAAPTTEPPAEAAPANHDEDKPEEPADHIDKSATATSSEAPVSVYFEVAWDRAAGGAPFLPRVSLLSGDLGNVVVDGVDVPVDETAYLKENSQMKFSMQEGVDHLVLGLAIRIQQPKPMPQAMNREPPMGWGGAPRMTMVASMEVSDCDYRSPARESMAGDQNGCDRCITRCARCADKCCVS